MNAPSKFDSKLAFLILSLCLGAMQLSISAAQAADFPCSPSSDFLEELETGKDVGFCEEWNPEFSSRGFHCCPKKVSAFRPRRRGRGRYRTNRCTKDHIKKSYCDEMTDEQRKYTLDVATGKQGDVLELISRDAGRRGEQAFCTVNTGFLAWGRSLVPTEKNRIRIRNPERCVNFGTDPMVGLIEWVGRKVASEYSAPEYKGTELLIGDMAAPRGGCLSGISGRKAHASHTSGQDADIGFLTVKKNDRSPSNFHQNFDVKTNWWLIKQIFQNPYACVKMIFLDKRLIGKLRKTVGKDELWPQYSKFIRNYPGHKNHLHVRVGAMPGSPGCLSTQGTDFDNDDEDIAEEFAAEEA